MEGMRVVFPVRCAVRCPGATGAGFQSAAAAEFPPHADSYGYAPAPLLVVEKLVVAVKPQAGHRFEAAEGELDQMADIERRKFELGESDLLKVALREQYALEAAEEQVEAELTHFSAFSDYAASLGIDRPEMSLFTSEE